MAETLTGKKRAEPTENEEKENDEDDKEEENKQDLGASELCVIGIPKYTTDRDLLKHIILPVLPNPEGIVLGINKKSIKEAGFILFASAEEKSNFITRFQSLGLKLKYPRARISAYVTKPIPAKDFRSLKAVREKCEKRKCLEVNEAQHGTDDSQVLPWKDVPYTQQVAQKLDTLKTLMEKHHKQMKGLQGGSALEPQYVKMITTPETALQGYRNKAELTIGYNAKQEIEIGFVHGKMEAHNIHIESAAPYPHVSAECKQVAGMLRALIQSFYDKHKIMPWNRLADAGTSDKGFWRLMQVRQSNKTLQMTVTIAISDKALPSELEAEIIAALKSLFPADLKVGSLTLVSLCLIRCAKADGVDYDYNDKLEVLHGDGFYVEELLGYKFQVSPFSFLQVNSVVAEQMYDYVRELTASCAPPSGPGCVVFDLYCGIGTIGICLSKIPRHIVGIEEVPAAIANAQTNARLNAVQEKTEYRCGKVEDLIGTIAGQYTSQTIVAIVDPPRCGLHKDVVRKIRTCKGLDILIYVSCNQQSMLRDIEYLCRPSKGKIRGPPFTVLSFAGADLFPYTPHAEAILLLRRIYGNHIPPP